MGGVLVFYSLADPRVLEILRLAREVCTGQLARAEEVLAGARRRVERGQS